MKASILTAPKQIVCVEKEKPVLKPGEALVSVRATGLCGTDVMVYNGELASSKLPITNGHEAAGIIEEICEPANGFALQDAVFFRGSWGCGDCSFCRSGRAQLCKSRAMLGVDLDGTMAEYVVIPTAQLFHLSGEIPFSDAQSLIGISCGVNLVHSISSLRPGMSAVIFGPGHAGLIILQLLRHAGFQTVVMVVGHRESRARLARELGADATIPYDDPNLAEKIQALLPDGPDLAIESSGSTAALRQCIQIVRKKGQVLAFSIYHGEMDHFPVKEFYNKEITITGVKGASNYYQDAEALLRQGAVKIAPMITHRYSLDQVDTAFQMFRDPDAVRIIVER